jgi:hypothetical protein
MFEKAETDVCPVLSTETENVPHPRLADSADDMARWVSSRLRLATRAVTVSSFWMSQTSISTQKANAPTVISTTEISAAASVSLTRPP